MTRVLEIVGEPFLTGGQEAFIVNVIKKIDNKDLQIDLYTPYCFNNNYYKAILDEKGCKVFAEGLPFVKGGFMFNTIKPISKVLSESNYDIVHIHSGRIQALSLISFLSKINGVKRIIVHSHASGDIVSLKHRIVKTVMMPLMICCPTDYYACSISAGEWKYSRKIVKNRMKVLKNGIDLDSFKIDIDKRLGYRTRFGYLNGDLVIGHVGRFSEEKNHRFIIELFSELRKKSDRYKLLLVGDGDEQPAVKSYAEQLGVIDKIVFTGNVDNVQDYLQAMDLFVLPSKFEGLGIVGIEAQACGLPCVFSDGVPKDAKITENVELISLQDKSEWINKIEEMILWEKTDNTEMIKLSGYDINETVKQLETVYLNG